MGVAFRVNLAVADPLSIAMAFMQDEIKSALRAKANRGRYATGKLIA
jgi:hypothetical protein